MDLGKYLGVPLIHRRVTKATYAYLLEQIDKRLNGWAASYLSLAGRVTLAKSVLQAVPIYSMQSNWLPKGVCMEIERRIRRFIWGRSNGANGISLVNWDLMQRPTDCGGVGLRNMECQNQAFLLKLGHQLISNGDRLWVRILRAKYKWEGPLPCSIRRANCSRLWRGISVLWDEVYNSVCWNIRDGMDTDFWYDTWIAGVGPLAPYFTGVGDPAPCNVASMAFPTGQWDFSRMSVLLPDSILYRISAIRPPQSLLGTDAPSWRWTNSQNFSSKVAYDRVAREGDWVRHTDWKVLWKMNVPQRIRMFLWLAKSEKLLTNKERVRRHLTASPCCSICFAAEESVIHVLRDCVVAGNTWRRLVRPGKLVEFMALPFDEWLMRNLRGGEGFALDAAGWGVLFPTMCWTLWKTRCKQVMEPDSGVVSDPFFVGHQLAAAYAASAADGAKLSLPAPPPLVSICRKTLA
ncbi:hypothetical protein GQ457_16G024540 [Hibiscus cannabinus]